MLLRLLLLIITVRGNLALATLSAECCTRLQCANGTKDLLSFILLVLHCYIYGDRCGCGANQRIRKHHDVVLKYSAGTTYNTQDKHVTVVRPQLLGTRTTFMSITLYEMLNIQYVNSGKLIRFELKEQ